MNIANKQGVPENSVATPPRPPIQTTISNCNNTTKSTESQGDTIISRGVFESQELRVALHWAQKDFRVFPLFFNSKVPALMDFPNTATDDEATIRKLWSGSVEQYSPKKNKKWVISRNSNIGILTTGLIVLDFDTKDENAMLESLKTLRDNGLPDPFMIVDTPSGGYHYYYRDTQRMNIKNGVRILPCVDVRGKSGYVVAAGSVINGQYYKERKLS